MWEISGALARKQMTLICYIQNSTHPARLFYSPSSRWTQVGEQARLEFHHNTIYDYIPQQQQQLSIPLAMLYWPYIYLPYDSLQWRHNGHDSVSNHQPHDCLLNRLFRRRSKKASKLRVTGLCAGNSPGTGEFPAQMASYAENVSIWWHHHVFLAGI